MRSPPVAGTTRKNNLAAALRVCGTVLVLATNGDAMPPPGAEVPWQRYEAEKGRANAMVIPPNRDYLTHASEASGRSFVQLVQPGDFVEITAVAAANGLVVRYSIPDSADGTGLDATLSLYVNGQPQGKLALSSRYAWVYGDFPWTNDPAAGRGHHFYDECRRIIDTVQPGDVVRLQIDPGDDAPYYAIDLIELEPVPPPLPQPGGSLSIEAFGGIPDDGVDDTAALLRCFEAARAAGRSAWLPAGVFTLDGEHKPIGGVEVRGAGMWHTVLGGNAPMFRGTGERFSIADVALIGQVNHRNDYTHDNAFSGNLGDGSEITRVWVERLKCGIWSNHGTRNLRVSACRFRNTMADGINLCDGTTDSTVEQCHFRNNGDDALATWSPSGDWSSRKPCERNRFLHNTVEAPWYANGIGLYGGRDHEVRGNRVSDTVMSGGGLLISSSHGALPFEGSLFVGNNLFLRTGGACYVDGRNGGLWLHAHQSDIGIPVIVRNLEIIDSAHAGITVHGPMSVRNLRLEEVRLTGADERGIEVMPSAPETALDLEGVRIVRTGAGDQ